MPVDKQKLEECIRQAADGDQEMYDFLKARYEKNEAAATKFVGGFMAQSDYTQKTQALAAERKTFTDQSTQVENYRKALEQAEAEKNKIMNNLSKEKVTVAQARELMNILKDKYGLTNDDLPGMDDMIKTAVTGKVVDSTPDLATQLAEFKNSLMSEMEKKFAGQINPELSAMAKLPLIMNDVAREHEELTGRRLTYSEQQEILDDATKNNMGFRTAWENKFGVGGDNGLRMQKRDERLKQQWEADLQKKQAEDIQRQALNVVTPQQKEFEGRGVSAAFKTQFRTYEMDPNKVANTDGVPTLKVEPGQHVRRTGDRGPSAAERAARKFVESNMHQKTA